MRISVKRIGGYAGVSEEVASADTAILDPARAQQLEQTVRACRFFDLPPHVPGATVGADLFRYEITVTEGDRRHTVTFDEDGPEIVPLRDLVAALTQT